MGVRHTSRDTGFAGTASPASRLQCVTGLEVLSCSFLPVHPGARQVFRSSESSDYVPGLRTPSLFVGTSGNLGPPDALLNSAEGSSALDKGRIFLKHQSLHIILEIDRDHPIGSTCPSGIKDVTLEAALTVILDMEDSVAAVDAEDVWLGRLCFSQS